MTLSGNSPRASSKLSSRPERYPAVARTPGSGGKNWAGRSPGYRGRAGKLERMVTGYSDPADYFSVFRNWVLETAAGHRWYRNQVVTLVDDHDQVRKGNDKYRFAGDCRFRDLAFNVLAVQLTTMGIPCIYDRWIGARLRQWCTPQRLGPRAPRETCSAAGSAACACRGTTSSMKTARSTGPWPRWWTSARSRRRSGGEAGKLLASHLRRNGVTFDLPHRLGDRMRRSLVCWSRLFIDQEVLIAMNTDESQAVTAFSTVSPTFRLGGGPVSF